MNEELTGRRRYQRQDNVLILQVEISMFLEGRWICRWRNATVSDVQREEYA